MLECNDDYSKSVVLQLSEAKQRLLLKDGPKLREGMATLTSDGFNKPGEGQSAIPV